MTTTKHHAVQPDAETAVYLFAHLLPRFITF